MARCSFTIAQGLRQNHPPNYLRFALQRAKIGRMWRFSRSNGITEGFHRKMKLIQRRAYGFRNFNNYRLRVLAQCS